jgi:hypothetical protein
LSSCFGLQHEHKHPKAWSRPRGGTADVDSFLFHCENLADYDECRSAVAQQLHNDQAAVDQYMTDMCTSVALLLSHLCWNGVGAGVPLTAADWLPELGGTQFTQFGDDIDMRSVMLYSSFGGNKAYGVPVYEVADPFLGASIVQPDGGYSHYQPSAQDIEGAVMLSPNPRDSTSQPPFYTSASPFHATWEDQDNPFDDCYAGSVTRRATKKPNKRHEQLKRRGVEARAAMRLRVAAGSYI